MSTVIYLLFSLIHYSLQARFESIPDFCPIYEPQGRPIEEPCPIATDPNRLPKSKLEKWFTKKIFNDLFPWANLGLGPHLCLPYSYESFIIAARYFPEFGSESPNKIYSPNEHSKRDLAAFFAHVLQETGKIDLSLYNNTDLTTEEASDCFYRGGFYNWFEGGPNSSFLHPTKAPSGGLTLTCLPVLYQYNTGEVVTDFWFPCNDEEEMHSNETFHRGCYFGRGPLQLSWNYNYGQFQQFLLSRKVKVDLLSNPNLIITKLDPPLAMIASLWFYMTPQPPKPAMHDIVMGTWKGSDKNRRAGYSGPSFGPTSLIINNECKGEDPEEPGGPGESRRIKAFKWFCKYFNVTVGPERSLSCKGMLEGFEQNAHMYSWQPDWGNMWRSQVCDCKPAPYGGPLPYYDPKIYPERFVKENERNRLRCVYSIYHAPEIFRLDEGNSPCLKHKPKVKLYRNGYKDF